MFLLDTMVVSEAVKQRQASSVMAWLRATPIESQFISALSLGEVLYGIRRAPDVAKRGRLTDWVHGDLMIFFGERVLPIDATVADVWAGMRVQAARSLSAVDGLIAATALAHGMTIVTRNERHMANLGAPVINPWLA